MNVFSGIAANFRDIRSFGPGVLLRFLRDGRPVHLKEIGQVSFRRHGSDFDCFRLVHQRGDYNILAIPLVRERFRRELMLIKDRGKTPLIVDGGANVGSSAIWFAKMFPGATINAIEPDIENFALLNANVAGYRTITPIHAALGSIAGHAEVLPSAERGDAVRTKRAETGIPVVTINDVCASNKDHALFLVKIDIEGFERDLFEANLDWLDDAFAIVIEPHDWMLPGQHSSKTFMQAMCSRNFEIFIVGENLLFVRVP